jgi:hypothetical protein
MFDWIAFLDQNGIDYITTGPNVSKGNIYIKCPECGQGDPSHHMGISLSGQGWACWRDRSHSGKSAARLVKMLIGCSWDRAYMLVGDHTAIPTDIEASVRALLNLSTNDEPLARTLSLPPEFRTIRDTPSARIYRAYLLGRGYSEKQMDRMSVRYGVRYCTKGDFRGRIIFPIHYEKKLVNWTGRTIYPNETLRYKTLTVDKDHATVCAVGNINKYLLWYDDLMEDDNHTIVVVEGPFDALRIRMLGRAVGITSTCFFTSSLSRYQTDLLFDVLPKYQKRILLLDQGTVAKAQKVKRDIEALGIDVMYLPKGIDDPGDLTRKQFHRLFDL